MNASQETEEWDADVPIAHWFKGNTEETERMLTDEEM